MDDLEKVGHGVTEIIKSSNLSNLVADYAETGIDEFLQEGLLKELPFVKTFLAIRKTGIAIRDHLLIKKLIRFLGSLESLPPFDRYKMIERLEEDPNYGRKVGEHLIELLDRVDSFKKPVMMAEALKAYAREEISVIMLQQLYFAIETLPAFDIPLVGAFYRATEEERKEIDSSAKQRLMTAGLATAISAWSGMVYRPTGICDAFVRFGLDNTNS